ncbi:MAG: mismatch-specific DNA-glycosylase [Cycloclasticus sp. symbiont of Poecilosclerida sp. M]|nr:MAG: mismatch-specific DNA-glycosylase [Cycloclasticus sp. symbiont of Poecilosclerida sp. M]
MHTLPDLLGNNLSILSVGLNPSIPSVKAGFYFANPRNRFWKALNACGIFIERLEPSLKSCEYLHTKYRIGFTDLIKRPTAGCKDLNATDYKEGTGRLQQIVTKIKPNTIWFHGKLTCQKYVQYSENKNLTTQWGEQTWKIAGAPVIVTPNPSPANAAYSLQVITDSYRDLFKHLPNLSPC